MTQVRLSPSEARALIKTLAKGTTIAAGARYLHVGHTEWIAAQEELLHELREDGGSETKFVRGTYGAGKSHFLYVMEDRARDAGWLTAHVECRADEVQIDRFETLYPAICRKLRVPSVDGDDGASPMRTVLKRWWACLCQDAGLTTSGSRLPFDAGSRILAQLDRGLLRANLPTTFQKALTAWAMARLGRRDDIETAIVDWLTGWNQRVRIEQRFLRATLGARRPGTPEYFDLRPLGKGTAQAALRGLLWLAREGGHTGLVLSIDEVEELARLPKKRRDQALQALREHVDDAGSEYGHHGLCLYLAATPNMFVQEDYFPRYDALQTRIQPVGREINWRGPVIDLDQTPLSAAEMADVAVRLRDIYRVAYGEEMTQLVTGRQLDHVVTDLCSRNIVPNPRQLVRTIVDELERARPRRAS